MPDQVVFISYFFVAILAFLLYLVITAIRDGSLKKLTKDFKRKLVMTLSLGIVFFGFYACLVIILSYWLNNKKIGVNLFFLAYQHPLVFFYQGLFVFVFLSLLIYLARIVIKYLYLSFFKE